MSGTLSPHKNGFSNYVELVVVAHTTEERDGWMNVVRIRICPWQALYHRFKNGLLDKNLARAVLCSLTGDSNVKHDVDEEHGPPKSSSTIVEKIQQVKLLPETVDKLSGLAQTVATVVKTSAPAVKDTAQAVADVFKCVTIVSSLFQAVVLCATLVEMGCEMQRGEDAFPGIRETLKELYGAIVESIEYVLRPDAKVKELLVKDVFEVQENLFKIVADVEEQLMRKGLLKPMVKYLKAGELKTIEDALNALKRSVVDVVQTGEIAQIRSEVNPPKIPVLKRRPKKTPFFVGRDNELDQIKNILDEYGSMAVMQYGGIGKTQLATAFADRAEKKGWVPGGSFWIRMGGKETDAIDSLAEFTESLTGRLLGEKDRIHLRAVVSELRRQLDSIQGRWLLCLDNADDPEVNPVLDELSGLTSLAGGWVIVTSRQGSETLWEEMVPEQKLSLAPMNSKHAMITLMRRKEKLLSARVSTAEIEERLVDLESSNIEEYKALCDLASDKEEYGMAGLPLALVQAGSFMNKKKKSFAVYLKLYRKVWNSRDVRRLLIKAEETGLENPRQKTVLTTWKISTDALTQLARAVIRACALFDSQPFPRKLVEKLDSKLFEDELMYDEVIEGELVHGTSLLQEVETETEAVYEMHQLIHQFVTLDTREDERCFQETLVRAMKGLHNCAAEALASTGDSFSWPPQEYCCQLSRTILPHSTKVLRTLPSTTSDEQPEQFSRIQEHILEMYWFTIRGLHYLGRTMDAWSLCSNWNRLLKDVHELESDNRMCSAAVYDIGNVALENGFFREAEKQFRLYLDMYEEADNKTGNHLSIANCCHQLGRVFEGNGKFDEARNWYQDSLEMKRRIFGRHADNLDIARSLNQVGSVCQAEGKLDEAEMVYKESLEMKRRIYGRNADHSTIAYSLSEVGSVYLEKGKFDQAERLCKLSLKMQRRIHGPNADHPDLLDSLNNLGRIFQEISKFDEAGKLYKECLDMARRIHGQNADHPSIAASLNNLGIVSQINGKLDEAEESYKTCLEVRKRIHGSNNDHPSIAVSLHQLGNVSQERGKLDEAEKRFKDSLEMERRIHGQNSNHSSIAGSLYSLGCVCSENNKFDEAEKWYNESLEMQKRKHGQNAVHPRIADTLWNMAVLSRQQNNLQKAAERIELALDIYKTVHGDDHPRVDQCSKVLQLLKNEVGQRA